MRNLLLAGVAAGAIVATAAQAQATSGNIMGVAKAGDTVVVDGVGTGVHREITLDKDGKYNLRRMPLGSYVVVVKHADGTAESPKQVAIQAGVTARVQ
jgi:uncharacterized membrane protein